MTEQDAAGKARKALLWVVTILASMGMLAAGVTKFTAAEMWAGLFTEWGYSIAFKNAIGVLEVGGALLVLVPRLASYAALLMCVIMLGAIYTVWSNQSDLGYVTNTGNLVLFGIVAYARWGERWTPGG